MNTYCSFSSKFAIPEDKFQPLLQWLTDNEEHEAQRYDGDDWCGFSWEPYESSSQPGPFIAVFAEEFGSPDAVVNIFQRAMAALDFSITLGLEWCYYCDKRRIGEFGGGCVAFNRYKQEWMNTSEEMGKLTALINEITLWESKQHTQQGYDDEPN